MVSISKGKVDIRSSSCCRTVKHLDCKMKMVEMVFEERLHSIAIFVMQFVFVSDKEQMMLCLS